MTSSITAPSNLEVSCRDNNRSTAYLPGGDDNIPAGKTVLLELLNVGAPQLQRLVELRKKVSVQYLTTISKYRLN